jgi:hypothetical protein
MTSTNLSLAASANATLGPAAIRLTALGGGATGDYGVQLTVADPPGTVDVTLNGGGVELQPFGPDDYTPAALVLRPAGGIVVAAVAGDMNETAIVDLGSDGQPTSFGMSGTASITDYLVVGMGLQPDGSLATVGFVPASSTTNLMQWDPTGHPLGTKPTADTRGQNPTALVVQPGGGQVVYSHTDVATGRAAICRRSATLAVDDNFGSAGCWLAGNTADTIAALSVDLTNHIYAGGTVGQAFYTVVADPSAVSVTELEYPVGTASDVGVAVTASNGAPLVGGSEVGVQSLTAALARSGAAGADPSFGGGVLTIAFGGGRSELRGLATQADGKIIAVGISNGSGVCARFTTGGILDASFGNGGVIGLAALSGLNKVAIALDGRIVVIGKVTSGKVRVTRIWP